MHKLALTLIAGSAMLTSIGYAQADTPLRIGNGMTVITIPSSNDRDRAFASSQNVRPAPIAPTSKTAPVFGSRNGAGPHGF